ncbi:hypothetical protein [Neisseria sicca]|nr:hypothetical protein [Neisseria sicca]
MAVNDKRSSEKFGNTKPYRRPHCFRRPIINRQTIKPLWKM